MLKKGKKIIINWASMLAESVEAVQGRKDGGFAAPRRVGELYEPSCWLNASNPDQQRCSEAFPLLCHVLIDSA